MGRAYCRGAKTSSNSPQNQTLSEPNAVGAVRLHRLLAVFVRAVTHDVGAQTAVEDVLLAEAKRLCDAGYPGPLLPLYPHLRAVTEAAQQREDARTADLATALGDSLYRIGDYAGAQLSCERALALREQALVPEHPLVAESLNNLAVLYHTLGRYAEAEPLLQRALALWERGLGPEHPLVATGLNNLAELFQAQGRYAEAKPLYERALALQERVLGPDHPSALIKKILTDKISLFILAPCCHDAAFWAVPAEEITDGVGDATSLFEETTAPDPPLAPLFREGHPAFHFCSASSSMI
jgi:tetratricopeptide (TPR) repeat protein